MRPAPLRATVLLCACLGCQAAQSQSTQPASGGSSSAPAGTATGAPTKASSAPPAQQKSLPPLSQLGRIVLTQGQGGPALIRCKGVVYRMEIDLARNQWTYASCPTATPGGASPAASDELTSRQGTFDAGQRKRLDDGYAKLLGQVAPSCGSDGGTLALELWRPDGTSAGRYVNENWGCKKPPPMVAVGIGELARALLFMVHQSRAGPTP